MDEIQKILIAQGREDLAQKYYNKVAAAKISQEVKDAYLNFNRELEHRLFWPYGQSPWSIGESVEGLKYYLLVGGPVRLYIEPEPLKPHKDIHGVKIGGIRVHTKKIKKNFKLDDYEKALDVIVPILKAEAKKR